MHFMFDINPKDTFCNVVNFVLLPMIIYIIYNSMIFVDRLCTRRF